TELLNLPNDTQICNCNAVSKGTILEAIAAGKCTIDALGTCTKAGTGCGTCQPILGQLIDLAAPKAPKEKNKVEQIKEEKTGVAALEDVYRRAENHSWADMTEADKQRFKWYGLFFRVPTPGNFMLRLRMEAGRTNAAQFRTLADLSDQYGKGFVDI